MRPASALEVWYEPVEGRRSKVGRLASVEHEILFEYSSEMLTSGLELSPFRLRLQRGVIVGDPNVFEGLMGLFADSLPDGWGRMLLDRKLASAGLSPSSLGPVDRLAYVGGRGMGALVYEPELGLEVPTIVNLAEVARDTERVLANAKGPDLDRLIALGGSPHGARPKALVLVGPNDEVVFGAGRHRPGYRFLLVKFRARSDDRHAGVLEYAYSLMARAAGIRMPPTRMIGRTRSHPGYFAAERFDRLESRRHHVHTLCGLLHVSHRVPSLTYLDLLRVTRKLTRSEAQVSEMFRRACFNVFAHNRDDHGKNFAFMMDATGQWCASPAYDLSHSDGPGGEHAMAVGSAGRSPTESDLRDLAKSSEVRGAGEILDRVRNTVGRFREFAEEAGVPRRVAARVSKTLSSVE
ncbi:MAG: type II toxin-antitoxin system HipA family toxin [Deltaproteobacteria bacterium]|nr:type II toxin-antitoxin system HipA family toxin [Deltaproteobacteria bacterium]